MGCGPFRTKAKSSKKGGETRGAGDDEYWSAISSLYPFFSLFPFFPFL